MELLSLFLGAPWWVWPLFCYLIFVGYSATMPRKMLIPLFFILPVVFLGMKVELLTQGKNGIKVLFCFSLISGFLFGFLVALREKISFDLQRYEVLVPGNWHTLFLLLLIFSIKFASGVAQAVKYEHFFIVYLIETIIHALIVGFFGGKAYCYTKRFFIGRLKNR